MSLSVGPYKVGGAGQCSRMRRRYPWQLCERPPKDTVTLNNSVEYFPTNTYLKREGGMGKNQSTKSHANSYLLPQHFAKNFKQASAYIISHEMPLPEASGHPSIAGKTADQHCLKVNFA